jgi:CubicO group peptidase (beta-lactamase class C family)
MRASTFDQPPGDLARARMAVGYLRDGSRVQGDSHRYPVMAAAGLWTTAEDLARFAIAVQASLRDGRPLLSQKMSRLMLQPGQNGHGLGPILTPDGRRFGHGGADWGFQGELAAAVDGGPGIAILTNSDNGGVLARQILMTVAREEGWADASLAPLRRKRIALSADALRAYVGRYAGSGGSFQIMSSDGVLRLIVAGNPDAELVPEAPDRFFFRENGATVRFEGAGDALVFVAPDDTRIPRIER